MTEEKLIESTGASGGKPGASVVPSSVVVSIGDSPVGASADEDEAPADKTSPEASPSV
ncbi:hypothetical protein [Nannocystis radixulma]|uniref:Uncharacterized protein n=1 Tax=Nannocystis radixulma TaxID=2995305 RepID=A0ABT5BHP3_9BACT|nr:hypothetical protein [Nannocystis radixulma]MDC0673617.1 hypothetical protein [Nannocystis radixulma]